MGVQRGGRVTDLSKVDCGSKWWQVNNSKKKKNVSPSSVRSALCAGGPDQVEPGGAGEGHAVADAQPQYGDPQRGRRVGGDALRTHLADAGRRRVAPPARGQAPERRAADEAVAVDAAEVDDVVEGAGERVGDAEAGRGLEARAAHVLDHDLDGVELEARGGAHVGAGVVDARVVDGQAVLQLGVATGIRGPTLSLFVLHYIV